MLQATNLAKAFWWLLFGLLMLIVAGVVLYAFFGVIGLVVVAGLGVGVAVLATQQKRG